MRLLALFAVFVFSYEAQAQSCRVLDPELLRAYSGPCVNGFAEGEGVASGVAEYRGGFKDGRKHGRGVKTWPNGDRYEGGFTADQKEGYGVYQWGSGPWEGERYDGTFAADRRHGYGIYWWPSGDIYSGPWEADAPTGPGRRRSTGWSSITPGPTSSARRPEQRTPTRPVSKTRLRSSSSAPCR